VVVLLQGRKAPDGSSQSNHPVKAPAAAAAPSAPPVLDEDTERYKQYLATPEGACKCGISCKPSSCCLVINCGYFAGRADLIAYYTLGARKLIRLVPPTLLGEVKASRPIVSTLSCAYACRLSCMQVASFDPDVSDEEQLKQIMQQKYSIERLIPNTAANFIAVGKIWKEVCLRAAPVVLRAHHWTSCLFRSAATHCDSVSKTSRVCCSMLFCKCQPFLNHCASLTFIRTHFTTFAANSSSKAGLH
jgi:hypothetical protein